MFIPLLLAFIGMAAHNEATGKAEYYWDMDAREHSGAPGNQRAPGNTPVQRRPAKLAPKSEFDAKPPPEKDAEVGGNTDSEHPAGCLGPTGDHRLQSSLKRFSSSLCRKTSS